MSISNDTGQAGMNNSNTVVKPAVGDTVLSGAKNDTIKWSGTGIANVKTLQYSLDSGITWITIATINNDSCSYLWNVPDTASTKALVRVTDTNNLSGKSGIFIIASSKSPNGIVVIRPALGEPIAAGMLNYQITWTGTGLAVQKDCLIYHSMPVLIWTLIGTPFPAMALRIIGMSRIRHPYKL